MKHTLNLRLLRGFFNVNPQRKLHCSLLILLVSLSLPYLTPTPSHAFCFEEAGEIYSVPPRLLWAIAKIESNFDPEAYNQNNNKSYDYGVMQINSSWKNKLGDPIWNSLSDPCQNVKVGAWILSQCIRRLGNTLNGIGCYNASSDAKQRAYGEKVIDILNQLPPR